MKICKVCLIEKDDSYFKNACVTCKKCKNNLRKNKDKKINAIYISTSENYAIQNKFIIGGFESLNKLRSTLIDYDKKYGDDWYYCKINLINNFKLFKKRFWNIFEKFRDNTNMEIINVHYHTLEQVFDFLVDRYNKMDIKFLNKSTKPIIDDNGKYIEPIVPLPLYNVQLREILVIKKGQVVDRRLEEKRPCVYFFENKRSECNRMTPYRNSKGEFLCREHKSK